MKTSQSVNLILRALATLICCTAMSHAWATTYNYSGETFFCTSTCDSFGALGGATGGSNNSLNSVIVGTIDVPAEAPGPFSFSAADDIPFAFTITSDAIALEAPVIGPTPNCPPPNMPGQLCNPTTVNPLPLDNSVATVEGSGIIGPDGRLVSGSLIFTFTVAPFSNNLAVITFDLEDDSAEGTVFGVVSFVRLSGAFFPANDTDADGVGDGFDNCIMAVNPAQRDTNGDGFGNFCDADLSNDCIINAVDLGLLRTLFFTNDPDGDLNGDGVVGTIELGIMRSTFFDAPGPSGVENSCD